MKIETRVALNPEIAEALRQVQQMMEAELDVPLTLPQVVRRLCVDYLKRAEDDDPAILVDV